MLGGGGSGGSVISADVNTIHSTNAGLMLAHRLRRWPSINPTLSRRPLFADTPSGSGGDRHDSRTTANHVATVYFSVPHCKAI